jgi:hypothetical protein
MDLRRNVTLGCADGVVPLSKLQTEIRRMETLAPEAVGWQETFPN